MKASFLTAVAGLTATAIAHGGVKMYSVNEIWYDGWDNIMLTNETEISLQRSWTSPQPITNPNSKDAVCNKPGGPSYMSATVRAGSNITAYWDKTFDHPHGPIIVWMTECGMRGSCSKTKIITGKAWFKIAQSGLESGTIGNGKWGAASMMANNFSHTATIPNSLPDGDYLMRHEVIALDAKPTAYYMQCAQLTIFNDGGEVVEDKFRVKIPGVYRSNDPSLMIPNLKDDTRTAYTVPGPPVYSGGQPGGTGYIPGWAPVGSGIVPPSHGGHEGSAPPGLDGDPANAADVSSPAPQATGNAAKAPSPVAPKIQGPTKNRPKGWGPRSGGQQAPENGNGLPRTAHANVRVAEGTDASEVGHPTGLYAVKDGKFVMGYGDMGWRA